MTPGSRGGLAPAAVAAPPLPTAARVQLFQRLRDQDPEVTPALGWLEEILAAQGTTAEETVRLEHQRQATMNVTVRNAITSMRLISWFDWAQFVESVSLVDEVLRADERVRADGLRDARSLSPRGRGPRPRLGRTRGGGRRRPRWRLPRRARAGSGRRRNSRPDAARSATRLLPRSATAGPRFERALGVRLRLAARLRRAYLARRDAGLPRQHRAC